MLPKVQRTIDAMRNSCTMDSPTISGCSLRIGSAPETHCGHFRSLCPGFLRDPGACWKDGRQDAKRSPRSVKYLRKSNGRLRSYLGPAMPCSAIESRRMLSVLCGEGDGRGSNVRGLPLNLCCLFVPGLVEGHLLIGIRRSAHVPRICMEESVVAEAVPKRPRYGLNIAQRARLRLRNGLEFIVLVLAGNEVGRHAPPSPGIVRQILAEVSAQGETAIAPIGVLLTVLRRCHKEPAIQRNQPIGEEFQATRHRRLIDASRAEHDVAAQYKRIKLLHGVQRKAITREATERAGRRITAIAWRNIIVAESNFRDLVLLIAFELPDRRLEQELTV